jgi:glycosyltransferase involved in cell wall biosynthesis
VLSEAASPADLTIVVARSDRGLQPLADFGVVQNASSADRYHFFIPSWVQPGLIPRAPERSTGVEEVAYVGAIKELDPDLASAAWAEALRGRGLRWDNRAIGFAGNDRLYPQLRWNDYASTDVVVALRPRRSWNVRSKPAAKLQNAWAAGVPAILSPESPYRELRRSRLDYLEAESSADVLAAIDLLRSDAGLYSEMVQNGLERAREFRPERLVSRWIDVLWREISARAGTRTHRLLANARGGRALARRVQGRLTFRSFRGESRR